jgi:hypothetical protein
MPICQRVEQEIRDFTRTLKEVRESRKVHASAGLLGELSAMVRFAARCHASTEVVDALVGEVMRLLATTGGSEKVIPLVSQMSPSVRADLGEILLSPVLFPSNYAQLIADLEKVYGRALTYSELARVRNVGMGDPQIVNEYLMNLDRRVS